MKAMEHYSGVSIMGFARSANANGIRCLETSVDTARMCGQTITLPRMSSRQQCSIKSIKQGV